MYEHGKVGDDTKLRNETTRITFAKNYPWKVLAIFIVIASAVVSGASFGLTYVAERIEQIWIIPYLWIVVYGSAIFGTVILVAVVFFTVYPLPARALWARSSTSPESRKAGLKLARNWREISPQVFEPVPLPNGDWVYPGIKKITLENGSNGLVLMVYLPKKKPGCGRAQYAESAALELPAVTDFSHVEVVQVSQGLAQFLVVVTDESMNVREVSYRD